MMFLNFVNGTKSVSFNFIAVSSDGNTSVGSIGSDNMTEEDAKSYLSSKYKNFKILSDEEFNSLDQEFLNAYDVTKKSLKINIIKAKEIKKEQLRSARIDILKKLDVEFMIALENNSSDIDNIKLEKQRLRDITNLVDIATTLEEIKAVKI